MYSVTSRAQTDYVSGASTPSSLFKPQSIDLSEFSFPKDVYPPFRDFCENGIVPESEAIQSSIASCCLKYQTPQVLAALLENGKIKTLNLSGTFLDDKSAKDLASLLKTNTTLQRIYLADNDFGTEGFIAICGALEENANLITLDLSQNDADGLEYVEAIASMVEKNRTLQILELGICRIDAEKLPILAKALEENLALTQLGLGFNLIGPEGISTILKIVEKKPLLKVLDLSGNKIGSEGGKLVAEILKTNTTLMRLDLAYNYLGPIGANAILNAIPDNATLRSLSLSYNQINGSNAKSIASMLRQNTGLSSLDLSCNQLFFPADAPANEAIDFIVRGLEHNTALTELDLATNHMTDRSLATQSHSPWNGQRAQCENDLSRVGDLLQRNRLFNALSEKDADLASQLIPRHRLSLDEGKLLAGAMIMSAASTAAYQAAMVEIQCCVNLLASQT